MINWPLFYPMIYTSEYTQKARITCISAKKTKSFRGMWLKPWISPYLPATSCFRCIFDIELEMAAEPSLSAKCLAEFIGTFLLIFTVESNVLTGSSVFAGHLGST